MKPLSILAFALLPLAFATAQSATQPTPAPPAVGDKAADFALDTLDGKTVRLTELNKTGPVVLIQLRGWVGYQCPICNRLVGQFISRSKAVLATGARVVFVYPGTADTLKGHAEDFVGSKVFPEGYFFVIDPDLKFVNDWHVRWNAPGETAYPATFVIDPQGVIRFVKISHTHGGRASVDEVLKALASKP